MNTSKHTVTIPAEEYLALLSDHRINESGKQLEIMSKVFNAAVKSAQTRSDFKAELKSHGIGFVAAVNEITNQVEFKEIWLLK